MDNSTKIILPERKIDCPGQLGNLIVAVRTLDWPDERVLLILVWCSREAQKKRNTCNYVDCSSKTEFSSCRVSSDDQNNWKLRALEIMCLKSHCSMLPQYRAFQNIGKVGLDSVIDRIVIECIIIVYFPIRPGIVSVLQSGIRFLTWQL